VPEAKVEQSSKRPAKASPPTKAPAPAKAAAEPKATPPAKVPAPAKTAAQVKAAPQPKATPPIRPRPRAKPAPAQPAPAQPAPAPARSTEPAHATGRRRIVVTGATGFVGRAVVRVLCALGDEVVVPARDRTQTSDLADMGATVVEDDLSDVDRLTETLRDADAVIHSAGSYRVGIRKSERGAMWDANIGTTTRLLDAAEAARTPRIVYVSTVGIFGNTRGQIVDETYRRDLRDGFLSWYDQTKYGAHEVAEQRARAGAPIVTVLPSQVYGPGDRSTIGEFIRRAHDGTLRLRILDDVGLGFVHVGDLAAGVVAALDRGTLGTQYVLSGPQLTLADVLAVAARLGGRSMRAMRVPTSLLRLMAPVGGLLGQPGLGEMIASSAGVTFWASSAKASSELGFSPRSIEDGLRDAFEVGELV
jgi:dihydroflavonol-4-reductase